jgi:Tol biopolymer transport system component
VSVGPQTVTLDDVAANCTVAGSSSISVEVPGGKSVEVIFNITCDPTGLEISTRTIGTDIPNYYELKVGALTGPIDVTAIRTVSNLAPGPHTVEIRFPGENCSAAGPNPIVVNVALRVVTPVRFEIECVAPTRLPKVAYHFEVGDATSVPNEIWTANVDGSGARQIAFGSNPSWSPDGKRVAYARSICDWYYGCASSLGIVDPESGAFAVYSFDKAVETPAWAPSGDVIAFVEFASETLFLIPSGGGLRTLVPIPGATRVRDPSWSPDGKRIALACLVSAGNYDICIINRDGTELVRLVQRPSVDRRPAWSPDGSTIAFAISPSIDTRGDIAVVSASGGDVTILTQGTEPSWSRDGKKLIFSRDDGLFTINPDGTNLTRLTTGKHRSPSWRP